MPARASALDWMRPLGADRCGLGGGGLGLAAVRVVLAELLGVEDELVAAGLEEVAVPELRQREADGLAGDADGLGELLVGDPEDHAGLALGGGGGVGEAEQGLDQPLVAVVKHEPGGVLA